MVKICDAFLFLQSELVFLHCRIILCFIELVDWTKEDKKAWDKHRVLFWNLPPCISTANYPWPHPTPPSRLLLSVSILVSIEPGGQTQGYYHTKPSLCFLSVNCNSISQLPFPVKKMGYSFAKSSKTYLVFYFCINLKSSRWKLRVLI